MPNDMDLRDVFAGQAMAALVARYPAVIDNGEHARDLAKQAYEIAGAMIDEKEKNFAQRLAKAQMIVGQVKCKHVFRHELLPKGGRRSTCTLCGVFEERY